MKPTNNHEIQDQTRNEKQAEYTVSSKVGAKNFLTKNLSYLYWAAAFFLISNFPYPYNNGKPLNEWKIFFDPVSMLRECNKVDQAREEEILNALVHADKNKDGYINSQELASIVNATYLPLSLVGGYGNEVSPCKYVQVVDRKVNRNGGLSKSIINDLLQLLGNPNFRTVPISALERAVDLNDDGRVAIEEVAEIFLSQLPEKVKKGNNAEIKVRLNSIPQYFPYNALKK